MTKPAADTKPRCNKRSRPDSCEWVRKQSALSFFQSKEESASSVGQGERKASLPSPATVRSGLCDLAKSNGYAIGDRYDKKYLAHGDGARYLF